MDVSHIVAICPNKRLVVIGCALPTPMACAYQTFCKEAV
jgi:hypothetical protein